MQQSVLKNLSLYAISLSKFLTDSRELALSDLNLNDKSTREAILSSMNESSKGPNYTEISRYSPFATVSEEYTKQIIKETKLKRPNSHFFRIKQSEMVSTEFILYSLKCDWKKVSRYNSFQN